MENETGLTCVRRGRPVVANAELYEVFERMHWICFHLQFGHDGDPDVACADPSCPWFAVDLYRRELESLGRDPDEVIGRAIDERYG